ncbi:SET domain-containing protein [Tilletiaria anomala UBC 951]|uniref:SET domain-containing protein n=1 Tax=Tilletiaria anomala (strain ATCC 24038 / CBS 436.72 / UBC 951) TaxID=1037660 RepID=A0A066WLF8_TILAU|nr:SET domain-containing protein [Tilletiaria anomala UBC 951]KDN53418.1 SET domain-containing protein [Tilletiaria anomala UBC 951]
MDKMSASAAIPNTASTSASKGQLFEIRDTPGKGKGGFALVEFAPGDLIMSERPFFTYSTGLSRGAIIAAVNRLPTSKRRLYDSFSKSIGLSTEGIALTNSLPMPEQGKVGMFENICRLNHACQPNAQYFWNDAEQREVCHCIRPIPSGSEILVSYTTTIDSRSRRAELKEEFGFACLCGLCGMPAQQLSASDASWSELSDIFNSVVEVDSDADNEVSDDDNSPAQTMRLVQRALQIIEEEQAPRSLVPRLCYAAFKACAACSDEKNARVWAARAQEGYRITKGEMSATRRMRELHEEPRRWRRFGTRQKEILTS